MNVRPELYPNLFQRPVTCTNHIAINHSVNYNYNTLVNHTLLRSAVRLLPHRCLHGTALPYLASELRRVANVDTRKRLRSSSTSSALVTPSSCRTTIDDRAFFVAAPRAWNTLPSSVTASETLGTFKSRLKTHLFATSFP